MSAGSGCGEGVSDQRVGRHQRVGTRARPKVPGEPALRPRPIALRERSFGFQIDERPLAAHAIVGRSLALFLTRAQDADERLQFLDGALERRFPLLREQQRRVGLAHVRLVLVSLPFGLCPRGVHRQAARRLQPAPPPGDWQLLAPEQECVV
jgi:hypothetical protein